MYTSLINPFIILKITISTYSQFSHANFPITIYHYRVLKIGLSKFPSKTYQCIKTKNRNKICNIDSRSVQEIRDLFQFEISSTFRLHPGIEAKKELSCINRRGERGRGWFPTRNPVENGGENKGRNGRLASFTEANSIGKIRRGLEGETFRRWRGLAA